MKTILHALYAIPLLFITASYPYTSNANTVQLDGQSVSALSRQHAAALGIAPSAIVTPQMYGAIADGKHDVTKALQSAINHLCSAPNRGGEVYLPAGRYPIYSVTIPCEGLYIRGAGIGNRDTPSGTQIYNLSNANKPLIYFKSSSKNYAYGGGVSNLAFYNDGSRVSTAPQIEADFFQQWQVENIYSFHAYNVIKIVSGRASHILHLYADDILPGGVGIELIGSGSRADSLGQETRMDTPFLEDISLNAGAPTGTTGSHHMIGIYAHGFIATAQLSHIEITNPFIGVLIDCTTDKTHLQAGGIDACPSYFDFHDVEIDFADAFGIKLSDFAYFKCSECYVHGGNSGQMENDIYAHSENLQSYGLEVVGGKFDQSRNACIRSSVAGTKIIGADIHACNLSGSPAGSEASSGIALEPDRYTPIKFNSIIMGNIICTPGPDKKSSMAPIYISKKLQNIMENGNSVADCMRVPSNIGSQPRNPTN